MYQKEGIAYQEMAVLFRTNMQMRLLAGKLMEHGVPFTMRENLPNLFDTWMAKDIMCYLQLALGNRSREKFLKIANRPVRYLSRTAFTESEGSFDKLRAYYAVKNQEWMEERIWNFEYDLKNASAQWDICSGGRSSCFIDWKGDIFGCPRCQVKIGNLYQNQILDPLLPCRRKVCDCYIAFSNLTNHPLHRIMGKGAFWRIPDKPFITSVFFDVDVTLTDAQGRVSESYAHALRYIAQFVPLYLATSLSMQQARRKLGRALFSLFEGGVFADGGLLVYGGQSQCMPVELLLDINEESAKITAHSYEGQVYKYSMLVYDKEERINILSRLKEKPYQVFYKPPLITVIHKEVDKRKGVLHICKALAFPLDQVLVVGNSLKDWEMMSVVSHSCAVMNAEPLLKERARYTLNPDRLAAFFRFRE